MSLCVRVGVCAYACVRARLLLRQIILKSYDKAMFPLPIQIMQNPSFDFICPLDALCTSLSYAYDCSFCIRIW